MVSVIVPIFNRETTLHRCIQSLLSQSFKDYEIILVNDGSTDSSGVICDKFAKEHKCIRVIHTDNRGPSAARNTGLDAALGDYIMFCDSDDMVEHDWINLLVKPMEDKDVILSSCNYCIIAENGSSRPFSLERSFSYQIKDFVLEYKRFGLNTIWHSCYRKNTIRFDERICYGEDKLYNFRYVQSYIHMPDSKITYNSKCLYCYFSGTEVSLTKAHRTHHSIFWAELRPIIIEFVTSFCYREEEIRQIEFSIFHVDFLELFESQSRRFELQKVKRLIKSVYWNDYCKSLCNSPHLKWLCERKSIALFWIYFRVYLPIRERIH